MLDELSEEVLQREREKEKGSVTSFSQAMRMAKMERRTRNIAGA